MRITKKIRETAWTALRTAMHIEAQKGVKSVEQLYKEQVLDVMDDRGMLPAAKCKGCGTELNADGNHPAELYAGTATGLCYPCTNKGPVLMATTPQGAVVWNCPPHSPSWRRDRETYFQFPGCDCDHGRKWVERPNSQGGRYPLECPKCQAQHDKHPTVVAARKAWTDYELKRDAWVRTATDEVARVMLRKQRLAAETAAQQAELVYIANEVLKDHPAPRFTDQEVT